MHATPLPMHGDILTEQELDDAVHAVQREALGCGMIPIAGIMSRRREDGRHEVLGAGHNHLREGRPGIHGETGAIMDMGRLDGGYRDLVATSSLSPCPFCQRLLARHMGVREVRILDAANYTPDLSSYPATLSPAIRQHARIAGLFRAWVEDDGNATVWARDIGIYDGPRAPVLDGRKHPGRVAALMAVAHQKARDGQRAGEAPIGAVVADAQGEVIGAGHARIVCDNDPSATAAMVAWRACGARSHWKDKTLLLTAGPDHIAYAMFKIFNFGQLIVSSPGAFAGTLGEVQGLGGAVTVLEDEGSDEMLRMWMARSDLSLVREYLGADYGGAG